jgi:branched-chain amino acid transport system ATP-binding protein
VDRVVSAIDPDVTTTSGRHEMETSETAGAVAALETRSLRKSFAGFDAVGGVDISVTAGHTHALLGPNGAGKTTLFNLFTGILPPTSGSITLAGTDITGWSPDKISRQGVGRSFQVTRLLPEFTAEEHLELALMAETRLARNPFGSTRRLKVYRERVAELLDLVDLTSYARTAAGEFPYGRKRALEIAIALARDPQLLLLDEPTSGMGLEDVDRTVGLIKKVRPGRTVVLVEHNMKVVASLADTVTVLQLGQVLAEGSYDAVRQDERVVAAYLGGAQRA